MTLDSRLSHAGARLSAPGYPRSGSPRLFHRGISLTEVLIAMGILTVGLLGVASVFPVASFYMQKGDVADRASAIAQAAFNEVMSRGMLNPDAWLMGEADGGGYVRYTKSFKNGLRDEIVAQMATTNALQRNQMLNGKYGYAYVIDPLGVEGSPRNASDSLVRGQILTTQRFPFSAAYSNWPVSWLPWKSTIAGLAPSNPKWPLVRLTLPQVGPTSAPWPLTTALAERLFASSDDLALDMPTQADRPSTQRWDTADLNADGKSDPLVRQSRGDYSWIVTVVPPSAEARNALATSPSAYEYEVSVAVFHKRIIDNLLTEAAPSERLTKAGVVSAGLSGGELLLEGVAASGSQKPFDSLKVGNWVAVCGPHPASTNDLPRFVMRWYRVLSIEGKDAKLDASGNPTTNSAEPERRLVSLRGPQWPWQPAPSGLTDYNHLSNNICVAIVPNVVAVHSKTVSLEGKSAWSMQ